VLAARNNGRADFIVGQPNVVPGGIGEHAAPICRLKLCREARCHHDDHPAQRLAEKDSSVHVAARLVRETKAEDW